MLKNKLIPPQWFLGIRDFVDYAQAFQPRIPRDISYLIPDLEEQLYQLQKQYRNDQMLISLKRLFEKLYAEARPSFLIKVENIPNFNAADAIATFKKTGMLFSTRQAQMSEINYRYETWTELAILKVQYAIEEYQQKNYPELFTATSQKRSTLSPDEVEQMINSTFYDTDYNLNLSREQLRDKLYPEFWPSNGSSPGRATGGAAGLER